MRDEGERRPGGPHHPLGMTQPAPPRQRLPTVSGRVSRTLTFWLRPYFVLRVANRFQNVAAFDRAIALASSALTALIPVMVLTGVVAGHHNGRTAADRIIDRYD